MVRYLTALLMVAADTAAGTAVVSSVVAGAAVIVDNDTPLVIDVKHGDAVVVAAAPVGEDDDAIG